MQQMKKSCRKTEQWKKKKGCGGGVRRRSSMGADGVSSGAYDTVHYHPADLHSWVQTMLTELNPAPTTTSTMLDPSSLLENPQINDPLDPSSVLLWIGGF